MFLSCTAPNASAPSTRGTVSMERVSKPVAFPSSSVNSRSLRTVVRRARRALGEAAPEDPRARVERRLFEPRDALVESQGRARLREDAGSREDVGEDELRPAREGSEPALLLDEMDEDDLGVHEARELREGALEGGIHVRLSDRVLADEDADEPVDETVGAAVAARAIRPRFARASGLAALGASSM